MQGVDSVNSWHAGSQETDSISLGKELEAADSDSQGPPSAYWEMRNRTRAYSSGGCSKLKYQKALAGIFCIPL